MPTANPSRRSRIAALAATADYNPEEAANAQRMLDRIPEHRLDVLAEGIKAEWGKGIESQFAIGRMLSEAKATFREGDHIGFGRWLAAQNFPFERHTAYNLRVGYEREAEVRALITATGIASKTGRDVGVSSAVQYLMRKPKAPVSIPTEETTPADPAFAALRAARNAILGWDGERTTHNAFTGMFIDDLRESGLIIKALADAYTEARNARG